jgi:HK97 family phage portal protein
MSIWSKILALRKKDPVQIEAPRRGFTVGVNIPVYEETAMQVSAFYRGVMYISTQIAKLPWQVKDKDNEIIQDTVANLIDLAPNPEMSSFQFRCAMIQNAIIHGNSYAEIERDSLGRPVALWPIRSGEVEPYRTPDGQFLYRVIGGSAARRGQDVYLRAEEVFHVKNFHTKDGIVGQGIVAYASDVLGISLGADNTAKNLFANGGLPSGVLQVPGILSDEAFQRIKESWKQQHGGRKAGGVAVLESGVTFSPISMSPDVLQFLESRKFNVLEIARFLGLPPSKLFDTEGQSYASQEQSNLEVATDTLDAWTKNLELEADIKLLKKRFGGRRTEMDLYEVFRGDMRTRADYFSKMMQSGAITPNQIRRKEGMAPYADGDRYWIAVNNFSPADRIDEIIDSQLQKGQQQPTRDVSQQVEPTNSRELENAVINFLKTK